MASGRAAGREYPRSYAQMRAWFDEDWKCLDYLDWLRFAMLATLCGLPALSLPVGLNADGLPVGLQLIGRPRGEARLLQIARRIDQRLALDLTPIDPKPGPA